MGIFDGPSTSLFAQTPDGRTLFRPFGQLGGTYEVPADRAEQLSVISVLMFAVGVWLCVVHPGRDTYFVAGFFGLCTVVNGAALLASLKRSR